MSESLEQRVAQLEKMLLVANEEIQRLKDRREDLDMVTEKAQQLEKQFILKWINIEFLQTKCKRLTKNTQECF